jgi:hypothetical protein
LLGDLLSGPLTLWPGQLSLFPAGLKAFYPLMLFLESLKMNAICFKFSPLCFVICYGLTGTKLSMMALSQILYSWLPPSRKQLKLMLLPSSLPLLQKLKCGYLLKKALSKSTLTQLLENTSQLKQLFAETTLAPSSKQFHRYPPLLSKLW